MSDESKSAIGDEAVVIGSVKGAVGKGAVVINSLEGLANKNAGLAIGNDAYAAPGSIAIGSGARAGNDPAELLSKLNEVICKTGDIDLIRAYQEFSAEVNKKAPDEEKKNSLWDPIKNAAALNGASQLLQQITSAFF